MTDLPPMPPPAAEPFSMSPSGSDLAPRSVAWGEAVKRAFNHYATFNGRASQSEFWKWWLLSSIAAWILWAPAYTNLMNWAADRTLHEAVLRIAGSPFITSYDLKRRARVAGHHFEGLSSFSWSDLDVDFDRSAQSWMPTYELASRIIHASGESVSPGTKSGASFLFRTPLLMEDGLREILRSHFVGFVEVSKRSKKLIPETLSANPDLVLDAPAELPKLPSIVLDSGVVVGDVKYKISEGKWTKSRADLAQLVFFASAFQSAAGFLVNFQTTSDYASADDAFVGNVPYRMIAWDTTLEDPYVSEEKFVGEVREWLSEILSESGKWHQLESVS